MSLAGHPLVLSVANADAGYAEVDGINDLSFGPSATMLETTDFKDTTGAKSRIAGLKDGTISVAGDFESADAGQALFLTQYGNGGALWVKILWDGIAGHKVKCIVESFELKVGVDGKVEFSATLQFNGAFAAV